MDEILKRLLESDVLTEATRQEIRDAFAGMIAEMQKTIRGELETEIRAQLTEQWIEQREQLVNSIDQRIEEISASEFTDLREDFARFRDLEVEFAQRMVTERARLNVTFQDEMTQLVEAIDVYLDQRADEEMTELREDLELVKKQQFGVHVFESFKNTFMQMFEHDTATPQGELVKLRTEMAAVTTQLEESKKHQADLNRQLVLEKVLSPLTGDKREQMAVLLESVETDKLAVSYETFIVGVLRESAPAVKPARVVNESVTPQPAKPVRQIVTGNPVITESVQTPVPAAPKVDLVTMRLAGLG